MIYKVFLKKVFDIHKEKGSIFYSIAAPINSLDEIKVCLKIIKKEHLKSNHIGYAYRLYFNSNINEFCSDGGEPKGSAGFPILNILIKNNLINSIIFVVRYFGGTKLGISGLINAYGFSANQVAKKQYFDLWKLKKKLLLIYSYQFDEPLLFLLNSFKIKIINRDFKENINMFIEIEENQYKEFSKKISSIFNDKIIFVDKSN